MSIILFANNAQTTLAAPITNTATSLTLAAGTGALFPVVTAGTYFAMTLVDAATGLINEIVYVTARSGDVCTITRHQEGTAAQPWLAGDAASNFWTAGSAAAMTQIAQLQQQAPNYVVDIGSTNALVANFTPAPSSLGFLTGAPIRVKIANSNTGSSTINVNGLGVISITNASGTNLIANQLVAGHVVELIYNGSTFDLIGIANSGFPIGVVGVTASTTWTVSAAGSFINVGGSFTTQTLPNPASVTSMAIGFFAAASFILTTSSGTIAGGPSDFVTSIVVDRLSYICVQSDGANWRIFSQFVPVGFPVQVGGVSTNTTWTKAANGLFINVSGSSTQTIPAASTVQGMSIGFFGGTSFNVSSAGGNIIGGPYNSSFINFAANEYVCLQSDGGSWRIFSMSPQPHGVSSFTAAGTYTFTVPTGVTQYEIEMWGAGSGSAAGYTLGSIASSGGGGGGYTRKLFLNQTPGNTFNVVVGAGGSPGNFSTGPTAGGTSSAAGLSATGGTINSGFVLTDPSLTNLPGSGSGGDINATGAWGFAPFASINGTGNIGGNGGAAAMGGGGGSGNVGTAAPGGFPGGGAGGVGPTVGSGQTGAAGCVIVRW